ncbi:mucin-2-like [Zingiber officinale]|uniref:mucin-2-like n=1 Tax=Zingiber officinale TaxID=94328 RepID=UPI001C4C7AD7|nr:mucin-2-like [Zingiber officinale]
MGGTVACDGRRFFGFVFWPPPTPPSSSCFSPAPETTPSPATTPPLLLSLLTRAVTFSSPPLLLTSPPPESPVLLYVFHAAATRRRTPPSGSLLPYDASRRRQRHRRSLPPFLSPSPHKISYSLPIPLFSRWTCCRRHEQSAPGTIISRRRTSSSSSPPFLPLGFNSSPERPTHLSSSSPPRCAITGQTTALFFHADIAISLVTSLTAHPPPTTARSHLTALPLSLATANASSSPPRCPRTTAPSRRQLLANSCHTPAVPTSAVHVATPPRFRFGIAIV